MLIIIIVVDYCRLVVHTDASTDTRAQKMVSHTVAHYRIGFAHDHHGEEQHTLSPPQL